VAKQTKFVNYFVPFSTIERESAKTSMGSLLKMAFAVAT